ncbi:uncharacterized protein NPIL_138781 [Nephila pilipes]|uniref:Uncharacterized protein n=1 Tax=Nephila pilipes TaxID=299642 RepID=A0A8X6QMC7_NEPPI|nr:uncharacterized protein NPIL_138781 [Nephila pilipes]
MALVPKELVPEYYQLNKPEIRVEDNISNLIHDEETTNDMKAKLLSHWIPKYQHLMQPSPPPKPFEIPKELLQETEGILNANIPIEWIGNKNLKESILLSQADPKWLDQSSPKESKPKKLSITERLEPFSSSESLSSLIKSKPKKFSIAERLQAFSSSETEPEKKVLKNTFSDPETSSPDRKWTTWSETKRLTQTLSWKTWRS